MSSIFSPFRWSFIRTPLLPVNSSISEHQKSSHDLALAIGSPSLFSRITRSDEPSDKTLSSLRKYEKRMTFRPTPYGLFGGVSMAKFSSESTNLRRRTGLTLSSRIDMSLLGQMLSNLEYKRDLRKYMKYFCNPEILVKMGRVWLERPINSALTGQKRINIKASAPILKAIEICRFGCDFNILTKELSETYGVSIEESENLCHQLCDLNILLSNMRFTLSNMDELEETIKEMYSQCNDLDLESILKMNSQICKWDQKSLKTGESYKKMLEKVSSSTPVKTRDTVQVDAHFHLESNSISKKVGFELAEAAELMLRLSTTPLKSNQLESYRSKFVERYQTGREVPICELLSPIFGLGSPYSEGNFSVLSNPSRDEKLLSLVADCVRNKTTVVDLSSSDLNAIETWHPNIDDAPNSLVLFSSLISDSQASIDKGNYKILISRRVGEIGASRAIGRFAHVLGEDANKALSDIVEKEQAISDKLLVDSSYWIENFRLANVVIAPMLRDYEIAVGCAPSSEKVSIPLDEIVVGVERSKFYAKWTKTGQILSVQSNNMLNISSVPEVVRFLIDISFFGQPKPAQFDWGSAKNMTFLPRLVHNKVIVSAARWNLSNLARNKNFSEFKRALNEFRKKWLVPSEVEVSNVYYSDNFLVLNLDDDDDIRLLSELLRKSEYKSACLSEHLDTYSWHANEDGCFATEIVTSFYKNSREKDIFEITKGDAIKTTNYLKPLGSDWLYFKLFCGHELHEQVIQKLAEFMSELKKENLVQNWFYIRYIEKQHQIRVRLKVDQSILYSKILPRVVEWSNSLVLNDVCNNFSVDSYDREIERYGGTKSLGLVEQLFCLDSSLSAKLINNWNNQTINRHIVGLLAANSILDSFEISEKDKIEMLRFAVGLVDKKEISESYREVKEVIFRVLSRSSTEPLYEKFYPIFDDYVNSCRPIARELTRLELDGHLTVSVSSIWQSLIHLQNVRLFGINRPLENKIRALLCKGTESRLMRTKYETNVA